MSWYNLTAVNATGILPLTKSINELFLRNQLGIWLLIAIYCIAFLSMLVFNNDPARDLMFAAFPLPVFAFMLNILDLVPDSVPFICVGIFALAAFGVTFTK